MSGAFWQNPNFRSRFRGQASSTPESQSPTPEITALYAANAAEAAARAEAVLAAVLAQAAELEILARFFTVSEGRLCIDRTLLSSDPTQDGELFDNGGLIGINYAD